MVASALRMSARPAVKAINATNATRLISGTAQTTFVRRKATLPDLKCMSLSCKHFGEGVEFLVADKPFR